MNRPTLAALLVVFVVHTVSPAIVCAQSLPDLTGNWTLNRQLSQFPVEIGFSADFVPTVETGGGAAGAGGRGGRRGAPRPGQNAPKIVRQSAEDSERVLVLTDEVRNPFEQLTIGSDLGVITITPNRAAPRSFHSDGRQEEISLGKVTAAASARWDGDRLVVTYKAETGRDLRYTYSLAANPRRLIVDVEFIERGGGDKVRRTYEPASASDTSTAPSPAPAIASTASPTAPAPAAAAVDQRPDAALRGISTLGVVVEDLSAQAVSCGLKQDALEAAIARQLTDSGFKVVRHVDDDTYVYVNISTATASKELCVSRYDVTLYAHTTAKLSYTQSPVLVQVELLHKGGITGGAPTAHADSVVKGVQDYVDQFATRIRSAGK